MDIRINLDNMSVMALCWVFVALLIVRVWLTLPTDRH